LKFWARCQTTLGKGAGGKGKMRSSKENVLSVYVPKEIKRFIEDLTVALGKPYTMSFVTVKLLEKAIELHKKGEFEI